MLKQKPINISDTVRVKQIQKHLVKIAEYKELVYSVHINKPYNKLGSVINRIMCYYENINLHRIFLLLYNITTILCILRDESQHVLLLKRIKHVQNVRI